MTSETAAEKEKNVNWKRSKDSFSRLTKTKMFQNLVQAAFEACDGDKSGEVDKSELYAGILYVHVRLARMSGPAACFPPTRDVVDELFDASDIDRSGTIDLQEFEQIMVICCAQIFSRMIAYYTMIILAVPIVAPRISAILVFIMDILDDHLFPEATAAVKSFLAIFPLFIQNALNWDAIMQKVVSLTFFMVVIPLLFGNIDSSSKLVAQKNTAKKIATSIENCNAAFPGLKKTKRALKNKNSTLPSSSSYRKPQPVQPQTKPPTSTKNIRRAPSNESRTPSSLTTKKKTDWILKVRPIEPSRSNEVIQISVDQTMSTSQLLACIRQVSKSSSVQAEVLNGLFRESDGVLVPLDHLVRLSETCDETYRLTQPGGSSSGAKKNISASGSSGSKPDSIPAIAIFVIIMCFIGWISKRFQSGGPMLYSNSTTASVGGHEGYGNNSASSKTKPVQHYGPQSSGGWEGALLLIIAIRAINKLEGIVFSSKVRIPSFRR